MFCCLEKPRSYRFQYLFQKLPVRCVAKVCHCTFTETNYTKSVNVSLLIYFSDEIRQHEKLLLMHKSSPIDIRIKGKYLFWMKKSFCCIAPIKYFLMLLSIEHQKTKIHAFKPLTYLYTEHSVCLLILLFLYLIVLV